ncbi:MAG: hypothetical protein WKF31_06700 [Thermoleophilaceae bacterium]
MATVSTDLDGDQLRQLDGSLHLRLESAVEDAEPAELGSRAGTEAGRLDRREERRARAGGFQAHT